LQIFLSHLNCVKIAYFQFKKEKNHSGPSTESRVSGGWQSWSLLSKISWYKGNCEIACWHDATASSFVNKVQGEVFAGFHAIIVKCHSTMQNWLFELSGQTFYEQSPWCQRKWWMLLTLLIACLAFYWSRWVWNLPLGRMWLYLKVMNINPALVISDNPEQGDMYKMWWPFAVPLSGPSEYRIRPDTEVQIKGHKKWAHLPSCTKFYMLIP
jgi:hypothetical protein